METIFFNTKEEVKAYVLKKCKEEFEIEKLPENWEDFSVSTHLEEIGRIPGGEDYFFTQKLPEKLIT